MAGRYYFGLTLVIALLVGGAGSSTAGAFAIESTEASVPGEAVPTAKQALRRVRGRRRHAPDQRRIAARLARRIAGARSIRGAVIATEEVLARGGLTTRDGRRVYRRALRPWAPLTVSRLETTHLAMQARYRRRSGGRISLSRYARMWRDFGMFRVRSRRRANVRLRRFLRIWVRRARRRPRHPLSFTPLFLEEMARRQQPSIRLRSGRYSTSAYQLTLLELELLAGAIERVAKRRATRRPPPRAKRRPRAGRPRARFS